MAGQGYSSVICAFQPVLLLVYRYNNGTKKGTVRTRKINVEALKNEEIKRTFQTRIEQRWELLMTEKVEGVEEEWSKVKSIFQDASVNTGAQEEQGKG